MNLPGIEKPEELNKTQISEYFHDFGLTALVEQSDAPKAVVDRKPVSTPYKPDLEDLYRLHRFVIVNKRTTVLEFGVGWSTLVLAHALSELKKLHWRDIQNLRRNHPFEVHSVDNAKEYIQISQDRIPEDLIPFTNFHYSAVEMTLFSDRIATQYRSVPMINPDFIYLDGPARFNVEGDINGITTAHGDMMPMACDILRFEHFLTPGTIIIVDGRTANARFMKANLQRGWTHEHDRKHDQHLFVLDEEPLGAINQRQIDYYAK